MPRIDKSSASKIAGERRYLTIMFADIVGSVPIAERLDPEEWHTLISRYDDVAVHAAAQFGGHIAHFLGDGILIYFGWPHALEHAAEGAVRAGLAILHNMVAVNHTAESRGRPRLSVRIGIHAGPVVVSADGEVFGDAANIAARVQTEAAADTLFITDTIHQATCDQFLFEDQGLHALKGVSNPTHLYRVTAARLSRQILNVQSATPFVGRETDVNVLIERWHLARQGQGQIVSIIGDAGIGKSRLVREFRRRIVGEAHSWRQSGGGQFFQNTPFFAIADLLKRLFPICQGARGRTLARIESMLQGAGLPVRDDLQLVTAMMDYSRAPDADDLPQATDQYNRLISVLVRWAIADAKRRPCILVLEDLHWMDPSTLAFVEAVSAQTSGIPILLILTARPEWKAARPWPANHTVIRLEPLDGAQVRDIIQRSTARRQLSHNVIEHIVARADGVPLFAEELARSIGEKRGLGESELPKTLSDSLTARLDRLGPAREIAQTAAVIGNEFSQSLVQKVVGRDEAEIEEALTTLVNARVLQVRGTTANPIYSFAHSLIKDAAYETLLKSSRRELHARIANIVLEQFPVLAVEKPEVVAHHWVAANNWERATDAWRNVAAAARSRGAFKETQEAYDRALAALAMLGETPQRDRDELTIQRARVSVLQVTHGYSAPETIAASSRAQILAAKIGDSSREAGRLISEWAAYSSAGNYIESSKLADRLLELALQDGRPERLADAYMVQVTTQYRLARLNLAERYFDEGQRYFSAPRFKQRLGAIAQTFGNASQIAWIVGKADRARSYIQHALAVAEEYNNPYDKAFSLHMAAMSAVLMREHAEAERLGREAIKLSDEHQFPQFACIARIAFGKALAGLDRAREGLSYIEEGLAGMSKSGSQVAITLYLTWLTEIQHTVGEHGSAQRSIERALSINQQETVFRPESLRIRSALRSFDGDNERAIADLREAIDMAKTMGAKIFELRARVSLCRTFKTKMSSDELRQLKDLLRAFREGFGTRDFKEAQSLVGDLAG